MEELVKYIVTKLVDDEEKVNVESTREGDSIDIVITVSPDDVGKVIGKNGKVAQAIRSILHSAAHKEAKKYILKIK